MNIYLYYPPPLGINTTAIFATLASVVGYKLIDEDATDSYDMLPAILGIQNGNKPI